MKKQEFLTYLFVKSPVKTIMVLLTTLLAVLFFSTKAGAAIYDDFTGPGIDQNKWTVTSSGFSQPGDGYLYYSGATPVKEKLTSTKVFPSGIFTMPFANYSSNNTAPPGEGLGSVMALGLGSTESGAWVRIERGQVLGTIIGQYIEVNWRFRSSDGEWSKIYVNYVQSDITSGFLQLRYDGTNVTFFYRTLKTDPWTQMVITAQGGEPILDDKDQTQPLVITPGWTTAVPMFIQALPGGVDDDDKDTPSYTLSFKVDYVRINSLATHVIHSLHNIIKKINNLEADYFKNANQQNTLTNKLRAVVRKAKQGSYADALDKLQNDILQKTDGCAVKGKPDRNDWITNCGAQDTAYPLIVETISVLQGLI
jgi:hypothetical protein